MGFWEQVNCPDDLKKLSSKDLVSYSSEIREHIIEAVNLRGGHLASNLGVIEMTLALHYVFSCPKDKIIWDVGHQAYTHKIITGRRDKLIDIRINDGISGFPSIGESECDCFNTGHSSTSLSIGLGMAHARDILGEDANIICVIGDGALTGGMAFEALNDIGAAQSKIIIILNDNKMSISGNVGAMSKYLTKLRLSKRYTSAKGNIIKGISALPFFGDKLVRMVVASKENLKSMFLFNKIFENLGLKYFGPIDGHDINKMIEVFRQIQLESGPSIIHLMTNKGNGHKDAEENPLKYHGINSVSDKMIVESNYGNVLGNFLIRARNGDSSVVAITAAMAAGTGLNIFAEKYPDSYFDVAIAEQHAVTMAAGMASKGLKPYVAIYSTFLQRAFDQIVHDVCLNSLPVRLLIDRAGVVGSDGKTHQGIFDISYLRLIPNLTICTPKDGNELNKILEWSLGFDKPLAIRYPKCYNHNYNNDFQITLGRWEYLRNNNSDIYLIAAGSRMLKLAHDIDSANIINALFIKPLDANFLDSINKKGNLIITLEDNVRSGGFGEAVLSYYGSNRECDLEILAHKDEFCDNRDIESSLVASGLSLENIDKIINRWKNDKE